ncbi:ADP-ribosylation factor-like protein 15 [Fusarium chlamydosporum]
MGATLSQLWTPPTIAVGFVGLHSAGKTTIIHKLSRGQKPTPPLTETINNTRFFQGSQEYNILDYSGDERLRAVWRKLLFTMRAIVFVIDSTDRENMEEARDALWLVLREEMLDPQPVLILANKQDSPKAMSVSELIDYLEIEEDLERTRKCRIIPTSAITGENLDEGLEWMRQIVRTNPY